MNKLHRRWQASLETRGTDIRSLLQQKRALTGPEVHELRVTLRRARLLAELGARQDGKGDARRFRAVSRAMLDALNDVRDCDVALDWLQTNGASAALTARLSTQRTRLWQLARPQLKRSALAKLQPGFMAEPKKLLRRLRKETDKLAATCVKTVQRAPEIPIPELHNLRRTVRRWRYLREMTIAPRQIRRDRRLKTLIEVQESLGELQNAEITLEQLKPLRQTKELRALAAGLRASFTQFHGTALQQIKRLPSLA